MDAAGYILALLAIITGLAISDMVVSLHGLLANRRNVIWDWLTLLAATFVFLQIVASWGGSYRAFGDLPLGPWFWEFVLTLCQTIGLYLAARAVLPDQAQLGEHVDLAAHYAFISRYVWASLSVTYALYIMFGIIFGSVERLAANWPAIVGLAAIIALAVWPHRKLHRLLVPAVLALLCASVLPRRLLGG
jgi:hypothetical protein